MNLKHTVSVVFAAMLLFSCKTPTNISYFQDSVNTSEILVTTAKEITVKRGDQLAIIVNSKDPALAAMFNLQLAGQRVGASNDASAFGGSGTNQITCYTVDS
ncbi:MAG: polysaccharide export protein, partial [Bacteroidaceae bacterium]|nr:polysaccharide export protein [Bacteroidaceae bacterium]